VGAERRHQSKAQFSVSQGKVSRKPRDQACGDKEAGQKWKGRPEKRLQQKRSADCYSGISYRAKVLQKV
jgi:hypothetical protein